MPTRIQFYHNSPSPIDLACEFTHNAFNKGRRVAIFLSHEQEAHDLDRLLWQTPPHVFYPHVRADHALAAETPIVLSYPGLNTPWPHHALLFNLSPESPPDWKQFKMLVEIVGQTIASRQPARQRWQLYKQEGYTLEPFDAEKRSAL